MEKVGSAPLKKLRIFLRLNSDNSFTKLDLSNAYLQVKVDE